MNARFEGVLLVSLVDESFERTAGVHRVMVSIGLSMMAEAVVVAGAAAIFHHK